jgi:hypothetical protein
MAELWVLSEPTGERKMVKEKLFWKSERDGTNNGSE